jgi:hypothetical protein
MDDALELLGPNEAFRDRRVRGYAVKQVARVDDDVSKFIYRSCRETYRYIRDQTGTSAVSIATGASPQVRDTSTFVFDTVSQPTSDSPGTYDVGRLSGRAERA